jgi:hypothetical protein
MTSSPRERKSHIPDEGEPSRVEISREPERSQQPKARKPIDRYDDQDSDFSDLIDNSLYERKPTSHNFNPVTSSPIERGRTRSRRPENSDNAGQPMSRSHSERPFYSRSPYSTERSPTSPERPGASHDPQNVSLGRISPILNGRGSPRVAEEKLVRRILSKILKFV